MAVWDWENLSYFYNPHTLDVIDAGPLLFPISAFSVQRDADGNLVLETTSEGHGSEPYISAPGTVKHSTESVSFAANAMFGAERYHAQAKGIILRGTREQYLISGRHQMVQKSTLSTIEMRIENNVDAAFTIEWIDNINKMPPIWNGGFISSTKNTVDNVRIFSNKKVIDLFDTQNSRSDNSHCLYMNVKGVDIYIFSTDRGQPKDAGYIVYSPHATELFRKKIRDVVSFCVGYRLECTGYIDLDTNCRPVFTKSYSQQRISHANTNMPPLPPAPLGFRHQQEVDQTVLNEMVNKIFLRYNDLEFDKFGWSYWHASYAPMHMAAAHYGATLEALRRTCAKNRSLRSSLIEKLRWNNIKDSITIILNEADIDNEDRKVLLNKISGLNQIPANMAMKDLLVDMDLIIGPLELQAWKRRNQAAHGSTVRQDDFIETIRETKILRGLVHRLILAATGASESYYDYYSIGFPVRKLSDPVPI